MFELKKFIDSYRKITILLPIRADGDAIGTALGIYNILKADRKQIEIVSVDSDLPLQFDFLPNFSKIKYKMSFEDSLVIVCGSSLDILGFDIKSRDILDIRVLAKLGNDGFSFALFGTKVADSKEFCKMSIVEANYLSASQVAFEIFKKEYIFGVDVATCFYTALVSGTQYFITNNVNKEVFDVASDMIAYGIDISEVSYNLNQRKSLSSLRILASSLDSLRLYLDGELSVMVVTDESIKRAGARYNDFVGIVDYGISLVTVKISILLIEFNGFIHVSIKSKKEIDISSLAIDGVGGGDKNALEFEYKSENIDEIIDILLTKIKEMELL